MLLVAALPVWWFDIEWVRQIPKTGPPSRWTTTDLQKTGWDVRSRIHSNEAYPKNGCKNTPSFWWGARSFWGTYWKSPVKDEMDITMDPPWNLSAFLHLEMDGWVWGSFPFLWGPKVPKAYFSETFWFLRFLGSANKKPRKKSQKLFRLVWPTKGHLLDRPARSVSLSSCWKLDRNWKNRICQQ